MPTAIPPGKSVKCPLCGQCLTGATEEVACTLADESPSPQVKPATKRCEYCRELILADAVKCRYCGEFFDWRAIPRRSQSELGPAEYIAATVLFPIGFIVAIASAIVRNGKAGKIFATSALSGFIAAVSLLLIWLYVPKARTLFTKNIRSPQLAQTTYAVPADTSPGEPTPGDDSDEDHPATPRLPSMLGDLPNDSEADVESQPQEIRRAMRANVRIEIMDLNHVAQGSGVVIRRDSDVALILTNRHVVDPRFALLHLPTPIDKLPSPRITYLTKESSTGTVVWVAPDEVDLAIVKTGCPDSIEPVSWASSRKVVVGEQVFAIGNPATMGWTLTRGTVSQLRIRQHGSRNVSIIQTDASISPGSSGGGLYNAAGELIGINNSIMNPYYAKGIGFSIRTDILRELKPEVLQVESPGANAAREHTDESTVPRLDANLESKASQQ